MRRPRPKPEDHALAAHVERSLSRFDPGFQRAQTDAGVTPPLSVEALGRGTVEQVLARAFALARAGGWLKALVNCCIEDRIVSRAFVAEAARQTADPGMVTMQKLLDPGSAFKDSVLHANGLLTAAQQVCRIEIDGSHSGTGFLIRPDAVMTAGHVLAPKPGAKPLFDAAGAPTPGAADRVRLSFGDFLGVRDGVTVREPVGVELGDDFVIRRRAPAGLAMLDAERDYALLRIRRPPKPDLTGLTMADAAPFPSQEMLLMQHPDGAPLSHHEHKIVRVHKTFGKFEHGANALGGSSGGPCFDAEFRVIGLHQGSNNAASTNVGELLGAVMADAKAALDAAGAPTDWLTELRLANLRWPVLDRRETQEWTRRSLTDPNARILAVRPAGRGRGMSFTADILAAMLGDGRHRVARLSADAFQSETPAAFARARLLPAFGAPADALPEPVGDTTDVSWLRTMLAPAVLQRLDQARDGRGVWIVLDDLRVTISERTGLREFLDMLYELTATAGWLRFVLLGYGGAPSEAARRMMTAIDLPAVGAAEARAWLEALLRRRDAKADPARALAAFDRFAAIVEKGLPEEQRLQELARELAVHLEDAP